MDVPSLSVSSKFISQTTLDAASETRAKEWSEMHTKLGQPVPELPTSTEPYDGRSLWEKLKENKDKKQDAIDEQLKFKNQFRALDEDEISFLDSLVDDNHEEEDKRLEDIKVQLKGFRAAVNSARAPLPPPSSLLLASSSTTLAAVSAAPSSTFSLISPPVASTSTATASILSVSSIGAGKSKKKQKMSLLGVVVKQKEPKRRLSESGLAAVTVIVEGDKDETTDEKTDKIVQQEETEGEEGAASKRRRLS